MRRNEYALPIVTFASHFCGIASPHVLSLLQFLIAAYSLWDTLWIVFPLMDVYYTILWVLKSIVIFIKLITCTM